MITSDAVVMTVTDESFEQDVVRADGLVMVDFWAAWCGPCRMIAPVVEQLARDYAGRVTMAKLDVDSNPEAVTRFGVRSIPSILFFRDGAVIDQVVGAVPRATLEQRLQQHLSAR